MDSLKKLLIVASLCSTFLGCSCKKDPDFTVKPVNQEMVQRSVTNQNNSLDLASTKTDEIVKNATEIGTHASDLEASLSSIPIADDVRRTQLEMLNFIRAKSESIVQLANDIRREHELVRKEQEVFITMGRNFDVYDAKIDYLEKETERLRNDALKSIYKYLTWLFVAGFMVIIGGAATVFFVERKLGFSILAIGIVTLAFGAAATYYLKWIAIAGFVVIGVGVASTIALLIFGLLAEKKRKTNLLQANKDNVRLVEALKETLPANEKEKFFGTQNIPGVAEIIQKDETKKIVAAIRGKGENPSTFA